MSIYGTGLGLMKILILLKMLVGFIVLMEQYLSKPKNLLFTLLVTIFLCIRHRLDFSSGIHHLHLPQLYQAIILLSKRLLLH